MALIEITVYPAKLELRKLVSPYIKDSQMKFTKVCLMVAIAFAFGTNLDAQTTSSGKFTPIEIRGTIGPVVENKIDDLSPVVGGAYTLVHGLGTEDPNDPTMGGFFFGINADPVTGVVNDAVMDGELDVTGADFADVFGAAAANEVVTYECLENLGMDPDGSGRFLVRLTMGTAAMGTDLQWDTNEIDNQDPLDLDGDGVTGKGPDGLYFTMDDVVAPDGFGDTGDGTLDATFPLDPTGLLFMIDLDGDGDATNDPPSPATRVGLFIGGNAGGNPVAFDPAGGDVTVCFADWQLLGADGTLADIDNDGIIDGGDSDGDGVADRGFDLSGFATFQPDPFTGVKNWIGDMGVGFGVDGNACSTQDTVGGNVRGNQLVIEYLSDIEPAEFCGDPFDMMGCAFEPGDMNEDGIVSLLDVDAFVMAVLGGGSQCQGDFTGDGMITLLDVDGFIAAILGG